MRIKLINSKEELLKHGRLEGSCLQNSTLKKKIIKSFEEMSDDKASELRGKVFGTPHTSVFEFVDFTFLAEEVSMVIELFLIKFRMASFNIKSRRYVDFSEQGYVIPRLEFTKDLTPEEINNIYVMSKKKIDEDFDNYKKLVDSGENKEDARFVLPLCLESSITFKMNMLELYKMIKEGLSESYTVEIEEFCKELKNICEEIFPEIFGKMDEERNLHELNYSKGIKVYPEDEEVKEVQNYRAIDGMMEDRDLFESLTGCEYKSNREYIKEYMSKKIKENGRINEFMDFLSPGVTFFQVKLSVSGYTHLVRHRMQSIIAPPLDRFGYIETYNIMDKNSKYTEIVEKNREFMKEMVELGVSKSSLIYFMMCGDMIKVSHKANLREFVHICNLRLCSRAQWEIRNIVKLEASKIHKVSNNLLEILSPSCISKGKCKEGGMACNAKKDGDNNGQKIEESESEKN